MRRKSLAEISDMISSRFLLNSFVFRLMWFPGPLHISIKNALFTSGAGTNFMKEKYTFEIASLQRQLAETDGREKLALSECERMRELNKQTEEYLNATEAELLQKQSTLKSVDEQYQDKLKRVCLTSIWWSWYVLIIECFLPLRLNFLKKNSWKSTKLTKNLLSLTRLKEKIIRSNCKSMKWKPKNSEVIIPSQEKKSPCWTIK